MEYSMSASKSKFVFAKQKYTNKTDVWYNSILIGELSFSVKEKLDVDWDKYRADKTLRMNPDHRWLTSWKAHTSANITTIGIFDDKYAAAQAILDEHHNKFKKIENNNE